MKATLFNTLQSRKELTAILQDIGFDSIDTFKQYMKSKAKLNEYGAVCYTEKRKGLELNYSDNCKSAFGIAGYMRGMFEFIRFN